MDDYFGHSGPPQQLSPAPAWGAPQITPAPSGMSVGVKILIGVGILMSSFVMIGILAAIAIPVFLEQRAKGVAAQTMVEIPSVAAGLPLRVDAVNDRLAQSLRDISLPGEHLAGAYGGRTQAEAIVGITKQRMSPADQRDYLAGSENAVAEGSADGALFGDVAPGSLGGRLRCSSAPTRTICLFVDAGAYGSVVVFGTPERGQALARDLRAAVEHRS